MNAAERLKRKVVSRLIGEVDVYYFEGEQLDGKVAKLTYGKRSILIQMEGGGYVAFLNKGDLYEWVRYGKIDVDLTNTIDEAKIIIKNDVMWEEVKGRRLLWNKKI